MADCSTVPYCLAASFTLEISKDKSENPSQADQNATHKLTVHSTLKTAISPPMTQNRASPNLFLAINIPNDTTKIRITDVVFINPVDRAVTPTIGIESNTNNTTIAGASLYTD